MESLDFFLARLESPVLRYLHYNILVPLDMVGVEISSWVEPQSELLLLATDTIAVNIGVEEVRLP